MLGLLKYYAQKKLMFLQLEIHRLRRENYINVSFEKGKILKRLIVKERNIIWLLRMI